MAQARATDQSHIETLELLTKYGTAVAAAEAAGVIASTFRARVSAARAWQRSKAVEPKGTPGFEVRELTKSYDQDGAVSQTFVKEGPIAVQQPGGQDAGPARDGVDGYLVKGVSTYYDGAGNVRGQWVKTKIEEQARADAIRAAYAAMAVDLPRVEPAAAPLIGSDNLLNLFTLTDSHVGMLAWHREGGADWDMTIAERVLTGCFAAMVEQSPAASTAIVNQLGDWMHYDGFAAVTPMHGHNLDADGRFQKMVEVSVRVLRRIIDLALAKHDRVHVIMAEGNHDLASSVWLRVMFAALYENEPRVTVNDSALPYYAYQHGNTMLAFHHGHDPCQRRCHDAGRDHHQLRWRHRLIAHRDLFLGLARSAGRACR